jgi:hypothetical protein
VQAVDQIIASDALSGQTGPVIGSLSRLAPSERLPRTDVRAPGLLVLMLTVCSRSARVLIVS